MKKFILFLCLLFPFSVRAYSASSIIAMDMDSKRVLYGENIDNERLIASITKIMTAIVTIECGNLEEEVEVGEEIKKAYGSAIYVQVGERLTIKDLLYGLMLRSGNDAAVVIAKNVAGSMDGFVMLMNEMASKLEMKNTYFYNNHGLEENDGKGNLSTARDMAILTSYAMENKVFREIFGTKKYTLKTNYKSYSWTSKNKLIHSEDYITGGKTGFTEKARRTLVTTGSRNNMNVVVVTLNDGNDFLDHKNMYASIFKEYEGVKVIDKRRLKINGEKKYKEHDLYLSEDIYVMVKNEEKEKIKINYELYDNKSIVEGDVVGHVLVYIGDTLVRDEDIFVHVVDKENSDSWWDKFKRWIKW